ncbi:MAG: hypothetical protein AAGN46_15525, partial [Acidobacteriota bacterium]
SIGESEYKSATFKIERRFSDGFQLQAHYTYSEDEDNDSNERSATGVTLSNPDDPNYDFGLSDRDVENRIVISGLVELPWEIQLSGTFEYRDGTPYTAISPDLEDAYCPVFNCPDVRAVIDGRLTERNEFRNEDITRLDLRFSKFFTFGDWRFDVFAEVFNVFDENSFSVNFGQRDPADNDFGIPDNLVTEPRSIQIGTRISLR